MVALSTYWWSMGDSNPRPHQCECIALSLLKFYIGIFQCLNVPRSLVLLALLLAIYYAPTREKMQY